MTTDHDVTIGVPASVLPILIDAHEGAEVTTVDGVVVRVLVTNPVTGAVCTLVPQTRIPRQRSSR